MADTQKTIWRFIKKPAQYVEGMTRHFTGATPPVDNKWYDIINNIPMNLTTTATYDAEQKLYSLPQGCNGEVYQTNIASTTEYVFRNLKGVRCTYHYESWGDFVRPSDKDNNGSFQILKVYSTAKQFAFLWSSGGAGTISTYINRTADQLGLVADALTTITYTSTGLYINGKFIDSWGGTMVNRKSNMLFGGSSTFGTAGMKLHEIRFYPFDLTEEQIIQNHETDKAKYGE